MAFSWNNCTAVQKKHKSRARGCFLGIYTYDYCLTPNVICGLRIWVEHVMEEYGKGRFSGKDIEEKIANMLRRCCNKSRVMLITKQDVENAEPEIIQQIRYSILKGKSTSLYEEVIPQEIIDEYNNTEITTSEDVENYLKGVPIY